MSRRLARIGEGTAVLLVLAGLVLAQDALASQHPVVVVQGSPSDPVVVRLVPELFAAGCTVWTDSSGSMDMATITQGDALLRVTPSAVEVWLVDHTAGRTVELDAVGIDAPRSANVAVTSVRVSEIVRAHFLQVMPLASLTASQVPLPPPPTPAPTAALPPSPPPSSPRLRPWRRLQVRPHSPSRSALCSS